VWPPKATPRPGCDPAYPDESTCSPPGPPFEQGCAIPDERNFTVLRPDPQRLDADKDGIGCEPIGGRP
jgi:micrococcal nuclease